MKTQVSVASDGMVFTRESKNGKLAAEKELFLSPMETDKAVDSLRHEVGQRGNVTRAALTCLVSILQAPDLDGYKGIGDINSDEGAKLPKEFKEGMRGAERTYFSPMFKDPKKLDTFLSGIRDAGIFATVKGVALKYFWFAGKLPCAYNDDGTPDTGRLLSVSAMQKLLQNMVDDKEKLDESIAARLGALMAEFCENETLTREDCQIILARLGVFTQEVKEAINTIDASATEKTENILSGIDAESTAAARDAEIAELMP